MPATAARRNSWRGRRWWDGVEERRARARRGLIPSLVGGKIEILLRGEDFAPHESRSMGHSRSFCPSTGAFSVVAPFAAERDERNRVAAPPPPAGAGRDHSLPIAASGMKSFPVAGGRSVSLALYSDVSNSRYGHASAAPRSTCPLSSSLVSP